VGAPSRTIRIANLIQEMIGSFIVLGEIKDPRVNSSLSLTRVEVSRDLSYADVFVSSYDSIKVLEKGVAGLQSAAGFIQSRLAKNMRIRQTPRLRFHCDTGLKEAFKLNRKIDELCASVQETSIPETSGVENAHAAAGK